MSDDKVLVPRDLIRRLIFSGVLLTEDELEEEVCALMTAPPQHSDGALTNEGAEPVALTAVAVLRDDGDGGLEPDWLLEGGTAELFEGMTLLVADDAPDLCLEDGHADLYLRPPAPASVVLPDGFLIMERGIWTEEQVNSAAKCIELLKDVPGMRARDLALAAMDAGQCKAPNIKLSDFACLDRIKELNS